MIALLIYNIIMLVLRFSGRKWPVALPLDWCCVPFDDMVGQVEPRRKLWRLEENRSFAAHRSLETEGNIPHTDPHGKATPGGWGRKKPWARPVF